MAAYGVLGANLCFTAWPRRIAFIAASVIVPILANGVRAWGTIYVAHVTDNEVAVGVDHLVYGWVFFAIVVTLLMAAAWPFFDRRPSDSWFDPARLAVGAPGAGPVAVRIAAAAVALAAVAPLWSYAVAAAGQAAAPAELRFPEVKGWTRAGAPADWRPHFAGADRIGIARYRDGAGREVDLALVWYARQEEGRELVGYGQGATGPDGPWSWTADLPAPPRGKAERIAMRGRARDVASFYRVGDIVTGSSAAVKLETMKLRLLGGRQSAIAVLVSSDAKGDGLSARPAVDAFLRDLGPIERVADSAAAR
jgi:EpsI family protein